MPIRIVLRALVLSVVVALFVPLLMLFTSGSGVVYDTPMDPKEFYQLSYIDQQKWLTENSHEMSMWEYVETESGRKDFWQSFLVSFGQFFVLCFVACCIAGWWEKSGSSSNKQLEGRRG